MGRLEAMQGATAPEEPNIHIDETCTLDRNPPRWVHEMMEVYVDYKYDREGCRFLYARCVVKTAMGDHARVVNPRLGIDKVVPIDELRLEKGAAEKRQRQIVEADRARQRKAMAKT